MQAKATALVQRFEAVLGRFPEVVGGLQDVPGAHEPVFVEEAPPLREFAAEPPVGGLYR